MIEPLFHAWINFQFICLFNLLWRKFGANTDQVRCRWAALPHVMADYLRRRCCAPVKCFKTS